MTNDLTSAAHAIYVANHTANDSQPRALWASTSSGNIELAFSWDDADSILQPGDAESAVSTCKAQPYMAEQLAKINAVTLREELGEWGAWEPEQLALADRETLEQRIVWLLGCSAMEEHLSRTDD